jgi:hypothetical protein
MGADKKSSWRMNSTYTPNPQPRIPTRVCQGHLVTTDLPTLGSNPNSKQHGSTTQESNNLGNLQRSAQTVGVVRADGPHPKFGRSASSPWTVCSLQTVRPHRADGSANNLQAKPTDPTDRNKMAQELTKNSTNTWPVNTSRAVHRPRADGPLGMETAARARPPKGQLLPFA